MYLPLHFSLNPCHNYIYKIILLHLTQFLAGLHFMPLSNALPTACSCCVLSNKYRMTTHWCLLAIICYICRSFSLCNKVLSMLSYCIKVSSPDSVVAPATQGRPLDDRNLFHLCNQYLSASDGNCFETWNYPVVQTTAYTSTHSYSFILMYNPPNITDICLLWKQLPTLFFQDSLDILLQFPFVT